MPLDFESFNGRREDAIDTVVANVLAKIRAVGITNISDEMVGKIRTAVIQAFDERSKTCKKK